MLEKTEEIYRKGKELYLEGNLSLTQISKELHIHKGRFTDYLKKQSVQIVNKQNCHESYSSIFEKIDTEEKAYWLGFLYADGFVGNKTNHIEIALATKDASHIEKFANFINFTGRLLVDDKRARITFRDKKMHDQLIKLGCTPNKSLTLQFPHESQVPAILRKHFVRGYIDGDGYIGMHVNGFGRLGITCGSEEFICSLTSEMNWRVKTISKDKRSNALSIEWSGYYVCDMLNELYNDASIYLDRKYKRYIEIENAVLSRIS